MLVEYEKLGGSERGERMMDGFRLTVDFCVVLYEGCIDLVCIGVVIVVC